jgi:hypothetical protein
MKCYPQAEVDIQSVKYALENTMMKAISIPQKASTLVLAFLLSSTSLAVVNPESGRVRAPVVLKCLVLSTLQQEEGKITTYTINCKTLEMLRTPKNLQLPDPLVIRYSVDHAAIERQAKEIQRMAAENPGYAGPGLDLPPTLPGRNQVILAYLRPVKGPTNETTFVPASGSASFELVVPTATMHKLPYERFITEYRIQQGHPQRGRGTEGNAVARRCGNSRNGAVCNTNGIARDQQ